MDRHEFVDQTAEATAEAHLKDLAIQGEFGVRFLTYWFDDQRQTTFCLATAPSREAVEGVHRASHGFIATQIIEVGAGMVERFMGGIVEHPPGEPYVDTAFRTILFTDIEGSTGLTQELGDARAMGLLHDHDRVVEAALERHGGSEVKHTGDGIMGAFPSVAGGLRSAIEIQRALAQIGDPTLTRPRVRVGVSAGEPVTERGDLFGATVQVAARLCQQAEPGSILVSAGVHDLARGKGFTFGRARRLRLKGFDEAVGGYELLWKS